MGTTTNYGWVYDDATDDVNTFPTRLANLAIDIDADLKNGLANKLTGETGSTEPSGKSAGYFWGDTSAKLAKVYSGSSWITLGGPPVNGTASVATSQSIASSSYGDLATVGPSVSVATGTNALVVVYAYQYAVNSGEAANASFAVSGATTLAADDARSIHVEGAGGNYPRIGVSACFLVTGLTAGTNTFTMKYRCTAGTAYFKNRAIAVIDMGS